MGGTNLMLLCLFVGKTTLASGFGAQILEKRKRIKNKEKHKGGEVKV